MLHELEQWYEFLDGKVEAANDKVHALFKVLADKLSADEQEWLTATKAMLLKAEKAVEKLEKAVVAEVKKVEAVVVTPKAEVAPVTVPVVEAPAVEPIKK